MLSLEPHVFTLRLKDTYEYSSLKLPGGAVTAPAAEERPHRSALPMQPARNQQPRSCIREQGPIAHHPRPGELLTGPEQAQAPSLGASHRGPQQSPWVLTQTSPHRHLLTRTAVSGHAAWPRQDLGGRTAASLSLLLRALGQTRCFAPPLTAQTPAVSSLQLGHRKQLIPYD